jgi:hypothetical protein
MRKQIIITLGILILLCSSGNVLAESGDIAISAQASSLGLGGEIIYDLTTRFNLRGGINYFTYSYSGTENDVDFDIDMTLLNEHIYIDWHPLKNGFRLTTGALFNQNELSMVAKSAATYEIGDTTYTLAEVGDFEGAVDFNDLAPYAGLGWTNAMGRDKQWGFSVDLGVVFQGEPEVDLTTNGTLQNNATFLAELNAEEVKLQDDLGNYQYYPVIAFGVTYRF